jgi:hypothetical protein
MRTSDLELPGKVASYSYELASYVSTTGSISGSTPSSETPFSTSPHPIGVGRLQT